MNVYRLQLGLLTLLIFCCILAAVSPSWAEGENETVDLFNAFQQEASSASRIAKPLSHTAENVIVITREQIEAINAHTLADILDTVPGITVDHRGGPGNTAYPGIQGASAFHTLVMVDGAPLNGSNNYANISSIPAQIIERVELLKGAASTAWGQALGGVIAVTTKSSDPRPLAGAVFASGGTRGTTDGRLELSGTTGNLGYYLSGGYLGSDGLRPLPNSKVNSATEYTKLSYDLPDGGRAWGTLLYSHANLGSLYAPSLDFLENMNQKELNATLGFSRRLTDRLSLELLGRYRFSNDSRPDHLISDGSLGEEAYSWEHNGGAGAKLAWHGEQNLLVFGGEYEHFSWQMSDVAWWWGDPPQRTLSSKQQDRFGFYLNDTLSLGSVSLSSGVRYDLINGDAQLSPSLGGTWQLTEKSLLRAYTGRGYSLPSLNYSNGPEKVWTSQVGVESTAIPYLWFKGTLLRNETWNIQPDSTRTIALGTELELKSTPVFNTSLGVGWLYLNSTEAGGSKATTLYVPQHTVHLSLGYDDHRFLRGTLIGRHILWNTQPEDNAQCTGIVWDLFLGATLVKRPDLTLELFFSGHNLFDTKQFWYDQVPNTGRWYEGGMKVRF